MEQKSTDNILEVSHLKKYFPIKGEFVGTTKGAVKAVDDVSFSIKRGTTMGLVGESGCGKSTTGRTILRLLDKTDGEICLTVRMSAKCLKKNFVIFVRKCRLFFRIRIPVYLRAFQ